MSAYKVMASLLLCGSLVACGGGGNNNLLNPEDTTGQEDTDGTGGEGDDGGDGTGDEPNNGDNTDHFTITNQFVGYFIENPELNPDDYSVGLTYIETLTIPERMEDTYNFEGLNSYKFTPCQDNNLFIYSGHQRVGAPVLDSIQTSAQIDGTTQTYYMLPSAEDDSSYVGAYNLGGSDFISNDCITHTLAARGKLEVYPLNTTRFADGISDAVISFDTQDPRQLIWNYEDFSESSDVEHVTVSLLHKSKIDELRLFEPIYLAMSTLAAIEAQEEANIAAAQAEVDTANESVEAEQTNVDAAASVVSGAEGALTAAQQKITDLDDLLAEIDRLQQIADYHLANPAQFTAEEIAAAQQAVIDAQKAYDLENIFRSQYQSEVSSAQSSLTAANNALAAATNLLDAANVVLAEKELALEDAQTLVKQAQEAVNAEIATYQPRLTDDVFLWQETLSGSTTSFNLPDSVQLIEDDYYLLNLVAWSSENEENFVYYHSSHVFRADGQQP